eukprot:scaffold1501_cov130-Cylindrotheca_fusiformis.AAC.16
MYKQSSCFNKIWSSSLSPFRQHQERLRRSHSRFNFSHYINGGGYHNKNDDGTTATTSAPGILKTSKSASSSSRMMIQGETLDLAADLRTFRPGDKLEIPYEITIADAIPEFWQSAFHSQDRINTSRPFCRQMLGLQDRVLPFSLVLFLASSMTHADSAKVQVGFGRVSYVWPAFAGDTFTKSFTLESIRNTSDGHHSILHITCDLINQRGRLCMRADKRMLFDFSVPESNHTSPMEEKAIEAADNDSSSPNLYLFRDHLMSKARGLQSHSLANFRPGQLILHSLHRSLTLTQSQQLASLGRLTHEKHFDVQKYGSELLIPGGLVLGLTSSASARDFHELLHEEIVNVNYVNPLHPGNMVGAISYIHSVEEAVDDLQVISVRTLGIKNMNVQNELTDVDLPLELLDMSKTFKANEIQKLCKTLCPSLHNKIVVQVDRRILRQAPREEVFLL